MKYFKIEVKRFYENDMVATNANGGEIPNGSSYFWKMDKGESIKNTPIFDYFYLESFDKKEYWEWMLCDVHQFIGEGSQIPGWLVSVTLKELLIQFNIAKPYAFYASKLLFKEEKQDYYIFHFSGKKLRKLLTNYVLFDKTIFYDPIDNKTFQLQNEKELIEKQEDMLVKSGYEIINIPIRKIVFNDNIDFISMQNFLGDRIVSEKMKLAIEENGITGFEFSELDYEVVVDKSV